MKIFWHLYFFRFLRSFSIFSFVCYCCYCLATLSFSILSLRRAGLSNYLEPFETTACAAEQRNSSSALIASYEGVVEVFIPVNRSKEASSFVVFEGQKYGVIKPKLGMKLAEGDLLRTGNNGKMKIIYGSGDVFIMGPASALTLPSFSRTQAPPDKASRLPAGVPDGTTTTQVPSPQNPSHSNLLYGKVRGLIDKKGPFSGLEITTRTAVSGIRGTDLVVLFDPLKDYTEVHVLRGEVQVIPKNPEPIFDASSTTATKEQVPSSSKPSHPLPIQVVKSGEKLAVEKTSEQTLLHVEAPKPSTQVELQKIKMDTTVTKPSSKDLVIVSKEAQKAVEIAEKKAFQMVIEDIKTTNPQQYESLIKTSITAKSLEDLNQTVVKALSSQAPKGSQKPRMEDFQDTPDEDVYRRFFKL